MTKVPLNPKGSSHTYDLNFAGNHVAILLSTFNGARFLSQQIDSIISQTHPSWSIYASDDGSSDNTLAILEKYQAALGKERLTILKGPSKGYCLNFMSLVMNAMIDADYFAFCDQDDIWSENKLSVGIDNLRTADLTIPALYCSRTRLVDENGQSIGISPLFEYPPSFNNALIQSIAGGNTMIFNSAARNLLAKSKNVDHIVSHDWWAYIIVSGCGGSVIYDPIPSVKYRQHTGNLIGSNASLLDRLSRIKKLILGTFTEWNDQNLVAIEPFRPLLTRTNKSTLQDFERSRKSNVLRRLALIQRKKVWRQTALGNFGLYIAALINRL